MQANLKCPCGATAEFHPQSPRVLGNESTMTSINTEAVNLERAAVLSCFDKWMQAHQKCLDHDEGPQVISVLSDLHTHPAR
jgi:hypothetical protein